MENRWYRGLLAALLVWGISGPFAAAAETGAEDVARVNGAPISRAQLEASIALLRIEAGGDLTDDPADERQLQDAALEQLIGFELLWQEARGRGVVVDDAAVDEAFAARRARFDDEAAFLGQLEAMGFSSAAYRDNLRRSLSVKRLLDDERAAVAVSKAEVQAFYEREQALMQRPEEIRVRHILIGRPEGADQETKRAEAEALLVRIKAGEDFARLATLYSEGPSRTRGGDVGFFSAGSMVATFEKAAFALQQPGDVSEVVETKFGYHIIRLEERRGGDIAAFEDVAIQIHDHLRQIRGSERIAQLTDQLRGRADIQVLVSR